MSTSSWSWSDPDALDTPSCSSSGDGVLQRSEPAGSGGEDFSYVGAYENSDGESGSYLSDGLDEEADVQDFPDTSSPDMNRVLGTVQYLHKLTTIPTVPSDGTASYQESRVTEWLHNQPSLSYDAIDSAVETPVTPTGSEDGDEGRCSLFHHKDDGVDADSESSFVTNASDKQEIDSSVESRKGGVVVAEGDDHGADRGAVLEVHEAEIPASEELSHIAVEKDKSDTEAEKSVAFGSESSSVEEYPAIIELSRQLVSTLTTTTRPATITTMIGETFSISLQNQTIVPHPHQITKIGSLIPLPRIRSTLVPRPWIRTSDLLLWARHFRNTHGVQILADRRQPRVSTGVPYHSALRYVEDDVFGFEGVLAQFPDWSVERYADGANLGRFGYL